jgi:NADPH:quinone reductase
MTTRRQSTCYRPIRMRAIQIDRTGGPEVMRVVDVPERAPGPGEVRIRHTAIGVNLIDTYYRTGLYKDSLPLVLGREGAGVVDAVGAGVTHLAVGDHAGYAANSEGSYAESRTLGAAVVVKLPTAIGDDTAAAVMLKGLTVQYLLRRTTVHGGLHPGDVIVWHAAAGGVGLLACQWAAALGLVVIGTAGSDEKCALAKRHGAAHVINYRREDVAAKVNELTSGRGVKAVFDSVGKDTWQTSLACLAPLGLMVSFGNASGAVPPISLLELSAKSLYVTRPRLASHLTTREAAQEMANDLFAMIENRKLTVEIGQRFALADAANAHRALEGRMTTGSTVLIP